MINMIIDDRYYYYLIINQKNNEGKLDAKVVKEIINVIVDRQECV